MDASTQLYVPVTDPYTRTGITGLTLTMYRHGVAIVTSGSDYMVVGDQITDESGNPIVAEEVSGQQGVYLFDDLVVDEPVEIVVTGAGIKTQSLAGYRWLPVSGNPNMVRLTSGATLVSGQPVAISTGGTAVLATSIGGCAAVGIAASDSNLGESISVVVSGPIALSTWDWIPGLRVWIDADGVLTQTIPSNGFAQGIGMALSATKIVVHPTMAISPPIGILGLL